MSVCFVVCLIIQI